MPKQDKAKSYHVKNGQHIRVDLGLAMRLDHHLVDYDERLYVAISVYIP